MFPVLATFFLALNVFWEAIKKAVYLCFASVITSGIIHVRFKQLSSLESEPNRISHQGEPTTLSSENANRTLNGYQDSVFTPLLKLYHAGLTEYLTSNRDAHLRCIYGLVAKYNYKYYAGRLYLSLKASLFTDCGNV